MLAGVPEALVPELHGLDLGLITAEPGVYTIRISAAGTNGVGYPRALVVRATPADGAPAFLGDTNLAGQVGMDFGYALVATNQVDQWEGRDLPSGLRLDPLTGALSGQPLAQGRFEAAFRPINESGFGYWQSVVFVIAAAEGTSVITNARRYSLEPGAPVQITFVATEEPVSYEASGLPDGLHLDAATGLLSGNTTQTNVTFQLWANNAVGQGDPVTFEIVFGETSDLRSWQVEIFGLDADDPAKESTVWGDLADPDGDGWVNLIEFAMGLNPLQGDPEFGPRLLFRSGEPVIQLRRRIGLRGYVFRLESSTRLDQWSEVTQLNEVVRNADATAEVVEWSPPFAAGGNFYRILILKSAGGLAGNNQ